MADTVYEEFCRSLHRPLVHQPHEWLMGGRWHRCPGTDPDAPAAPEVTVDLLIAKYQGRQEGLLIKLRSHDLSYSSRRTVAAQVDEVNDFLTDLHRLRATNQNGA